jgi:poly(3-hydroxybutyrate) depolymerase
VRRTVGLYVPPSAGARPALVVAFHGTGGNPREFLDELGILPVADTAGFVVVAPQAVAGRMGGPQDPDHWEAQEYGTGWNLTDKNPGSNDDVLLVLAALDAAQAAYGVDPRRCYAIGHSNGAFFAYFVAMAAPDRFAGFAENAGGAIRCENRGNDAPGSQFKGRATTCEALAREPGFPTCQGPLKPIAPPAGRVPPGLLAHHNDDEMVSVAWTCMLAAALGPQAEVHILPPNDDSRGHSVTRGFAEASAAFFARQVLPGR